MGAPKFESLWQNPSYWAQLVTSVGVVAQWKDAGGLGLRRRLGVVGDFRDGAGLADGLLDDSGYRFETPGRDALLDIHPTSKT